MKYGIHLRPRLQALADMITYFPTIMDVGCDHGRLGISLLQQGKAGHIIASDISAPSLEKAKILAEKCGLGDKVSTRVSNGLMDAAPGETDALVIAGMGGELIASILGARPDVAKSAKLILMQPMRGIEELRSFLFENGYAVTNEVLCEDAGRIYQIIAAVPNASPSFPAWFPKDEFSVGPLLFEKKDPLLVKMLTQYKDAHIQRLDKANKKGVSPEPLLEIINRTDMLISLAVEEKHED